LDLQNNWVRFGVCTVLCLLFIIADPAFESEDPNAEPGAIGMIGSLLCCGALVFLGLAVFGKSEEGQTVIINKTPAQRFHSPPIIIQQQPAVVNRPPPQYQMPAVSPQRPAPMQKKSGGFADQRKQIHLDRAHKMEMEGDFEGAITAYELAEEFREAQRVRWALGTSKKESSDNGPQNVNISIGKVGDTSVQDSVITGSDDET
jgi:hypothetical protein